MSSDKATLATNSNIDEDEDVNRLPLLSLIRHPETIANISHVLQGTTDSPLTVTGQQQARRLSERIAKSVNLTWNSEGQMVNAKPIHWIFNSDVVRAHGNTLSPLLVPGRPPTSILSSPAGRARHLAQSIADAIRDVSTSNVHFAKAHEEKKYTYPEVIIRERIAERCFGQREGVVYSRGQVKPVKDIIDPKDRLGLQSEPPQVFHQRVKDEFEYLISLLQDHQNDTIPPHFIVITHGLWIRTALEIAFGQVRQPFTQNTGIFTLALLDRSTRALSARSEGMNLFGLVSQNDTAHLIGLKRQRGGIGNMASDRNQQTLQQIWQSPPKTTKSNSDDKSKNEQEDEKEVEVPVAVKVQEVETSRPQQRQTLSDGSSEEKKSSTKRSQESHSPSKHGSKRQKNLFQMWKS
ncbi:phosphoglycerate mutase-like protein [Meira miltonrushii]|uniref:Phosphoglycerate mutase-like protein n=1 Tax=Meira miltonrushii TaxID=1280837 RepID=A0A316VNP3_9BASI|nr:phosphoglycerate mutase-like protein [Meira miltonrushii]PWN37741.1 phosphoglycerate mutase-like protein [Meira miltonrushii]